MVIGHGKEARRMTIARWRRDAMRELSDESAENQARQWLALSAKGERGVSFESWCEGKDFYAEDVAAIHRALQRVAGKPLL